MRKALSTDKLMKHLREQHGFDDLWGSGRKRRLRNMGYFHGYKGFRFVRKSEDRIPLSSFAELESIYRFDAKLKATFYPRVMGIETALKNIILACILAECSDPSLSTFCKEGLRDCTLPDGRFDKAQMRRNLELKATLQSIVRVAYRSPHMSHYINREGDASMWSVFESMSLGNLSRVASSLNDEIGTEVLNQLGMVHAYGNMVADLIELLRPLRNAIAHNNVIFDARFLQAVRGGDKAAVERAGFRIDFETGLGYEPAFNSIVDYMMLVCILEVYLTGRKADPSRFLAECCAALDGLRADIGIDVYMKIVGSGDRQKLDATAKFVASC